MPFFVTITINDLTQISIFLIWWPVAISVVASRRIGYIDLSCWGQAWRSWAKRATITTAFSIIHIIFIIFLRPVRGLGILGVLKRLGYRLLKPKRVLVENFLFDTFFHLGGRSMALKIANIYFLDSRQKVKGSFSLRNDSFLNGLLSSIFSKAILLGLDMDKKPQTVANQANQDWLSDHRVSIKFSKDDL